MANILRLRGKIHYGWFIVVTGTLVLFACLGLGRFALGMILPSMALSLDLSYSQMGLISTANFFGYLIAVLTSGFAVRRFGSTRLIVGALLLVGISMILVGRAASFMAVLSLYFLTGIGSGTANVPMMGLVSTWFDRSLRGKAAGFVVSGSGLAILLSGWMIPAVNEAVGEEGWRLSWCLLGVMVLGVACMAFLILRDRPSDVGLEPLFSRSAPRRADKVRRADGAIGRQILLHLGGIYFLFGFTYVIYATFIVTFLVQEHGYSESVAGTFWSTVGLLSLFSGPVFGTLSDRFGRRSVLMAVFLIQALSYLLAASGRGGAWLTLSVVCYGMVAWSVPSIMAALVGDYAGPSRAAEYFGIVTFIFGIGQIAGPSAAGLLADVQGSFTPAFALAAVLTVAAVAVTALLGRSEPQKVQ